MTQASEAAAKVFEERTNEIVSGLFKEFEEAGVKSLKEKETQVERISEKVRMSFEESAAGILDRYRTDIAAQASGQLVEVRETHAKELAAAVEVARLERETRDAEFRESLARTQAEALRQYDDVLRQKSEAWTNEAAQKITEKGELAVASLSRVGEQALRGSFLKMFEQISEAIRQSLAEPPAPEPDSKVMGAAASASSSTASPMMNPGGSGHDSHAEM